MSGYLGNVTLHNVKEVTIKNDLQRGEYGTTAVQTISVFLTDGSNFQVTLFGHLGDGELIKLIVS